MWTQSHRINHIYIRFQCDVQPQEMHELTQTENKRERGEKMKDISISDNTWVRTKCWSNLFLLKCQLNAVSMLWLYPAKPLPAALPSFLTLLMVLGSTRLVFGLAPLMSLLTIFAICMCFSWYFTVSFSSSSSSSFSPSNWIQEKSLWEFPHTHTHIFILFYGTWRKNRNLLAVNFTHSPRSLRQTFFTFFFPHYCRCSCCCCQNEKLLICHVWHKFQNSAP